MNSLFCASLLVSPSVIVLSLSSSEEESASLAVIVNDCLQGGETTKADDKLSSNDRHKATAALIVASDDGSLAFIEGACLLRSSSILLCDGVNGVMVWRRGSASVESTLEPPLFSVFFLFAFGFFLRCLLTLFFPARRSTVDDDG